jgi:3-oxoacyl-[acyl-carrier-protein] synthase-3
MGVRIIGCGGYLPKKVVSNFDLENSLDTTDAWIRSRTGINQRHIAGSNETNANMAYEASIKAINNANIQEDEIDLIIACTTTPDSSFPGIASMVHSRLSLGDIPAFDLQAVCSGFVYAMDVAKHMLNSKKYKTILVVCSEKMSSLLNWRDRSTCILFGDGAGAVILRADNSDSGIIDSSINSDGRGREMLYTSSDDSDIKQTIKMQGQVVFKAAVEKMTKSIEILLDNNKIHSSDIDFFIPHQANSRIIDNISKRLNLSKANIINTVSDHANCASASIPLALSVMCHKHDIKKGAIVLFSAFGAGTSWGSVILKW